MFSLSARMRTTLMLGLALPLSGCVGQRLSSKILPTQIRLQRAIADGSRMRECAPKATARAEAEIKFAEDALEMGETFRARRHLKEAEVWTTVAEQKTEPKLCRADYQVDGNVGDRDGDGYDDQADRCPDKPEDFDSFEDGDGCPDIDNDGDGILDAAEWNGAAYVNHDRKGSRDCRDTPEDKDGFEDEDGCPDEDNDGDGIPDTRDRCPNQAEDLDNFEDEDGCPEDDNDGDGILDAQDKCPNEPEDIDGDQDDDGCPDLLAKVDGCRISIDQKVFFALDKSDVDAQSFGLLNDVSTVLTQHPEITLEIGGHTDSQGSKAYNLGLSQRRVDAVLSYLRGRGIAAERLSARGYGESTPIESNRSAAGRAKNRRVEFIRTDGSCKKR